MNKRIAKLLLLLTLIISPITPNCNHQHDDSCGYNPKTQEGCTHIHDESCDDDEYDLQFCWPDEDHC